MALSAAPFSSAAVHRTALLLALTTSLLGTWPRHLVAQEDPSRFLFVTKWSGTLNRSASNSGSFPDNNCVINWNYSHSMEIQALYGLGPGGSDPPFSRFWFTTTNTSSRIELRESYATVCPDDALALNVREADPPPGGFTLAVNTQDNTYSVGFSASSFFNADTRITIGGVVGPPSPGSASWFSNADITLPLPASGLALAGNASLRLKDCPSCVIFYDLGLAQLAPDYLSSDLHLSWNFVPAEVEELEVVVDPSGYEQWVPEGNVKDWNKLGNTLSIAARLQTKDGQTPTIKASKFTFKLLEVSHEPGVCMNRPAKEFAQADADMRFDEMLIGPPFVSKPLVWIDEFTVESFPEPGGLTEGEAVISSYDFGGTAKLKVTADVAGRQIVGYLKSDASKSTTEILLPKRTGNSRVADAWKEEEGVSDLADSDDSETDPPGDSHPGDGLTLYEEYRGFSANLQHFRAHPKKKDLLIADAIHNWRSKNGIQLFAAQSGLEIRDDLREEELSSQIGQIDRWINFNLSADTPHVVNQHGLLLKAMERDLGYSRAYPSTAGFSHPSTPAAYDVIRITPEITAPATRDKNIAGMNVIRRDGVLVLTDNMQSTLAHEIAHACSVWHHGVGDHDAWVWNVTMSGDEIVVSESGFPIVLMLEPNQIFHPKFAVGPTSIYLGVQQGMHSGVEDCLMRYDVSDAYALRNSLNIRYWVRGDEVTGLGLCTTRTGSGINASDHVPQSRYGDALEKRGDCRGQICVNDRYVRDPLHER